MSSLLDLVGQGCGAALPNLRTAEALLAANRAKKVLSVCVEVCSAAFYLDDDPGVLISACLFGDGAGAAVLARKPRPNRRRVEWKFGTSCLAPEKRDTLRFGHKNGMLRNMLSLRVPQIAGDEAAKLFARSLAMAGVKRDRVAGWIFHAGGRDVLSALRDKVRFDRIRRAPQRRGPARVWQHQQSDGLFVLRAALDDSVPDGLWWMSVFGAGFSCHGALLEVGGREA